MNVFEGRFKATIDAIYVEQNRKTPLGTSATGEESRVKILVTEAYTNNWTSEIVSQTSDVLIYGQPSSVLSTKKCVGGTLKFLGRTMRIESFALARNQRNGAVTHSELGCSEL